jgi:DNA polymerase II large subunit
MSKEASERMEKYFNSIENEVKKAYLISNEARAKGFDPEETVNIPLAKNMAERVEGLISVVEPKIKGSGVSERINELEEQYGKLSWKVAFQISLEVAQEKFFKLEDKKKPLN